MYNGGQSPRSHAARDVARQPRESKTLQFAHDDWDKGGGRGLGGDGD